MGKIEARLRGKAIPVGELWSWEITMTTEEGRVVADLQVAGARLVETPAELKVSSKENFPTREAAVADMKTHATNIQAIIQESAKGLGLKPAGVIENKAKPTRKSTMVEFVQELEAIEPRTADIARMIEEAKAGEYHDYKNKKYTCGKVQAVSFLRMAASAHPSPEGVQKLKALAAQVINGEFDETADAEDLAHMRSVIPKNMWPTMGL